MENSLLTSFVVLAGGMIDVSDNLPLHHIYSTTDTIGQASNNVNFRCYLHNLFDHNYGSNQTYLPIQSKLIVS